jgi:hypothetical protein
MFYYIDVHLLAHYIQCTYFLYPKLGSQPDDDPMGPKHVAKGIIL